MKTFIIVCTLLAAQPCLIAGHNTVVGSGISIGVELSQSPLTLAMMHYNKDQWQVASGRDMRQIYTPVLYGLSTRINVKGMQFGLRVGVAPMHSDDQGSFQSNVGSSDLANGYTTYLRQAQFFTALSAGKKLKSGNFTFSYSAELPFIHYTEGDYVETVSHITYYSNSTAVNYTFQGNSHYRMPSGSVYGLGAGAECGYRFGRRIELALGCNAWLLRYTFNKPISLTYNTANASYRMDGGLNSRANGTSYYTLQSDASFWLMSGLMPAFRLYYHLL